MSLLLAILCASAPAPGDATLQQLVEQALAVRPELAQAVAEVRAAKERVPQAQAWAEPMFQVGVQNDSFTRWSVGTMEMSWVSFMASQTFPFPGKNAARGEVALTDVQLRELAVERVRLSTIAEVRRSYLSLQLVRAKLEVLERRIALATRLVEVARVRVQTDGPQSDVLRAQVELARAKQQQMLLARDAQLEVQALNRLRRVSLDTDVQTAPLDVMPELLTEDDALALARQHSPEWLSAKASQARAAQAGVVAKRSYLPDLSVSAGVMARGPLEPMWTLSLGVPLPVFAGARQSRALAESEAQGDAAAQSLLAIEQQLALQAHQRATSMTALRAVWNSYQEGLLAQANAAAESTLSQYSAGRVMLAAVLEANGVALSELEASLQVRADAWRLVIDQDELLPGAASPISPSSSPSPGM
jgi:outer membrane protein TolC